MVGITLNNILLLEYSVSFLLLLQTELFMLLYCNFLSNLSFIDIHSVPKILEII